MVYSRATPFLLCLLTEAGGCWHPDPRHADTADLDGGTTGDPAEESTGGSTMVSTTPSSGTESEAASASEASASSESGPEPGDDSSSSDTGVDPLCGNGDLDDGEACDDANDIDGDGCNVDCVESGTPLLTLTYDDPAHESDVARGVKVTPDGDFVVVGSVAHEAAGQGFDGWIRKYADDGAVMWTDTYNNAFGNGHDVYYGVDVDDAGTIAVAGYETRADVGQAENVMLRIYDADGNEDWTRTYNTSGADATDVAHGVGLDADGNVYVGGYALRSDLMQDRNLLVMKYDGSGGADWTQTYDNPSHGQDRCRDFRTDAAGNGVCAGYEYRADLGEGFNHLVIKLSPEGNTLWTHTHHDAASTEDTLWAVAISDDGDIVAAGLETRTDLGQGRNIWIRKLDADGNELWTQTQDGPASMDDNADAVVIDAAGNVIVVGNAATGEGDSAVWVGKFDPDGDTLWTAVEDVSDGVDSGTAVDVWPDGRIVVVGYVDATADAESDNMWIRTYAP